MDESRPEGGVAQRRRGRKVLLLGLALGVFGLLGLLAVVVARPDVWTGQVRSRVVPRFSEALGREVRIGSVHAALFPRPQVILESFEVAGGPGEPPFVSAPRAVATVRLWPLLTSLGRTVELSTLRLESPVLSLVRRKDGRWSGEEVLASWREHAAAEGETPAEQERDFLVTDAAVVDGRVQLLDWTAGRAGAPPGEVALSDVDLQAKNLGFGRALELEGKAALQGERQNIELRLKVDELPRELSSLAPGEWPRLEGDLVLDDVALEPLRAFLPARLDAVVTSGRLELRAALSTTEAGAYAVNGRASLAALELRGQPASGRFVLEASMPNGRPEALTGQLRNLELDGPGVDLRGQVQLRRKPLRVDFELAGDTLDVATLLSALPPGGAEGAGAGIGGAGLEPEALLSAELRKGLAEVQVRGRLAIARVVSGKLQVTELRANAALEEGVLTLEEGTARLYGGKVRLSGTRIDLREPLPRWTLRAELQGVELGTAMQQVGGVRPLEGRVNSRLSLTGEGNDWSQVREQLAGRGELELDEGRLASASLDQALVGALAPVLGGLGQGGVAGQLEQVTGTALRDLDTAFQVSGGQVRLERPLELETRAGAVSLGGAVGLDQSLALVGTVALSPSLVKELSGNVLAPEGPVRVPVRVSGTLAAPELAGVETAALARQLVTEPLGDAAERELKKRTGDVEEDVRKEAERRIRELLGR